MNSLVDYFLGSFVKISTPVFTVGVAAAVLMLFVAAVALNKRASRIAARKHRGQPPTAEEKRSDTVLFIVALVPTALVWLAVMGVSFKGLTGFAADAMHWDHWSNCLVPLSLDGISISFGAWAFVAVKRGRDAGRASRIVSAAAAMSALLNLVHGAQEWSLLAGGYLAFLSFAGMGMFHEFLHQFEDGLPNADEEKPNRKRRPYFGLRWMLAPISTFFAWRVWIVYPPEETVRPSVKNAMHHLAAYRDQKRVDKDTGRARHSASVKAKLAALEASGPVLPAPRPAPSAPQLVPPAAQTRVEPVPPFAPSAPQATERSVERVTEQPPAAPAARPLKEPAATDGVVDPDVHKYVDHMLALARAFPDWHVTLPKSRDALAALAEWKGNKGSADTTSKVLKAMRVLLETADPQRALEDLRVLRELATAGKS